jgi:hypothetical protein
MCQQLVKRNIAFERSDNKIVWLPDFAQCGGDSEIGQPDNLVIAALKGDVPFHQLLTHPLATVDVDLDRVV